MAIAFFLLLALLSASIWVVYAVLIEPLFSPLRNLPGPDCGKGLGFRGHLNNVLNANRSKFTHESFVQKYGRNIRIKGIGNWEDRFLTTDSTALTHVMNHTGIYQKPWQSRRVISRLIGEGMLAAEGQMHRRMRRIGVPAFSTQNIRAFVPIAFKKALELKDKWLELIDIENFQENEPESETSSNSISQTRLDICRWISRATFDVIGLAGFDYDFSAIQNEKNELFLAYKQMFEVAVSQANGGLWDIAIVYFPVLERIFPNKQTQIVQESQKIIRQIGQNIIREKTRCIAEGEKNGSGYDGVDFLSLLVKSNRSTDIPPSQRISESELLDNLNTFFFAGSDTTSLALTWTIMFLSIYPDIQNLLREELRAVSVLHPQLPSYSEKVRWQEIWSMLNEMPYLNNVIREAIRLIPPVHSSIRVAMQDDEIPTGEAVRMRDGSIQWSIKIKKGQFVHIPIESMNVDKKVWGDDAWEYRPDRWNNLPPSVLDLPGLYNHTMSFSAGPRACIGMRFSEIEMKCFLYVLVSNFIFKPPKGENVYAANVVLTRPYVNGKFLEGSQLPMLVSKI